MMLLNLLKNPFASALDDPSDFDGFWSTYKKKDSHESPTRFYKGALSVAQSIVEIEDTSLHSDAWYQNKDTTLRFVCTSDTHNRTDLCNFEMPEGDVLIHAGDFTMCGDVKEVQHFADWLDTLPYKIKLVVPGNHELTFDPDTNSSHPEGTRETVFNILASKCTVLEDSEVTINGIKIFGSPWQPEFGRWAYNLRRGKECATKWGEIPSDTDILVTHGPPVGHGDLVRGGIRAGCVDMLEHIQTRIKPKYHIFGHIHEAAGITTDTQTTYINASMCSLRYKPAYYPTVFDMEKVSEVTNLETNSSAEWNLSDPRK